MKQNWPVIVKDGWWVHRNTLNYSLHLGTKTSSPLLSNHMNLIVHSELPSEGNDRKMWECKL